MRSLLVSAVLAVTIAGQSSAARAGEGEPSRPLAPGFSGDTGVLRVHSARTGVPGYWDIGGHGLYFQQNKFIAADDYNEFIGAHGSISWTPFSWLELFFASQLRENFNSTREPNLDHANGAVNAGGKISIPIGPEGPVWIAVKGGTRSSPNVDQIQFRPDTWGAEGTLVLTLDLTERSFPLRMHGNAGYIYDRSSPLRVEGESPARTFALDLHDRNRATYGVALEVPFRYATPFMELSGAKPTDVDIADSPGFFTAGVRITPVQGLALDFAYDVGLTESVIDGLPATPRRQFLFGASYAFASTTVHRAEFEQSGELSELARARIQELNDALEAERLRAEMAEQNEQEALKSVQAARAVAMKARRLLAERTRKPVVGTFKGRLIDEAEGPVSGTLSLPEAPEPLREIRSEGTFTAELPAGVYQVDVKATGYLLQGRRISIDPGETVVHDFVLRPIPKERRAQTTGSKITLKDVINFGFNSEVIQPDSFAILDEVADIILANPDYSLVRIEGHTDDVGDAAYNLSLSDRRARAVMKYLLDKGVAPDRMQAVGWGKTKPISRGSNDSARAVNRRVEFNVMSR